MSQKYYQVFLSLGERSKLEAVITSDALSPQSKLRVRVLLLVDRGEDGPGWVDTAIAKELGMSTPAVQGIRQRYVAFGLEAVVAGRGRKKNVKRTPEKERPAADSWLTITEASEYSGYCEEHLRRMVRNGILKNKIRAGNKYYVRKAELRRHKIARGQVGFGITEPTTTNL